MADVYIKNNTGGDKTWVGQLVLAGEYYLIQDVESFKWANNSTLLSDIGSGDAVVARDATGSNDISDVSKAINYLKDDGPMHIADPFPNNVGGYSFRGVGGSGATINGTSDVDILIAETRLVNGAEVWTDSLLYGESVTFQVVDKDGVGVALGWYTQDFFDNTLGGFHMAEEFGATWQLHKGAATMAFPGYTAKVYAGLYLRLKVAGLATGNVYYNIHLHKVPA